jgi:FAD/FMN-containing dehydrogenase
MEPELTGRIVIPGDPQYDAARQEYNTFFNRFPLVIVFAQETQDVINAVRWARHQHVPIRMRSGRHNYEGLSVVDAGIVIDVSEMNQVDVDHRRGTVTVQTGLRDFALYETLGREGLVVPGGLCPTTGIAGLTLGGGASALARPYGLTIDHLLDLEMVDADGRVRRANADRHADLFWASRGGGGGNFGICTSFRFRTRPIDTVAYAEIGWDLRDLEPVLRTWQEYTAPGADDRLTPLLSMFNAEQPPTSFFPGSQTFQSQFSLRFPGRPTQEFSPVVFQGVFLGSANELRRLLRPLLRAGSPRQVFIEEIPWLEAVFRLAISQPISPEPFKSTGPFIQRRLPDEAIAIIRRFMDEPPPANIAAILFHGLGGAVARVPSRATAYYYREAWSNINPWSTWSTPEGAAPGIRWVEDLTRALRPFTRGVYVNTPDLEIDDWPRAYYGENFERLTRVKRRYDPLNVFHFPQSIPPA